MNLAACGGTFSTGPPWRDFLGINCLRCKVPQTDAIDQSPVKSGLGQGLTRLTRFFIYPDYLACLCVARRQVYPVKKWDFLYYQVTNSILSLSMLYSILQP